MLGPAAGSPHNRYAVLAADGRTVVEIHVSRPDGEEVRRPEQLQWRIRPYIGGEVKPTWFNNCPPAHGGRFTPKAQDGAARHERGFLFGWGKKHTRAEPAE